MNLEAIQAALREEGIDGWLFYDHHRRDPLAYRVLGFSPSATPTRRWYYLIPANGEPRGLASRIEPGMLASLPGTTRHYSEWTEQRAELGAMLRGFGRVAMQHSPECAVPYVAMVDAGTVDLIRSTGVDVVSSADLVQRFEAVWSDEQLVSHYAARDRVDSIRAASFAEIGRRLRAGEPVDEYAIRGYILDCFSRDGLFTDHGPIVAVNANASNPHYEPAPGRSEEIGTGDFVLIDLWARQDRPEAVYYDITWTGYCGETVPERIAEVFAVVSGARDAAVARVREAVAARTPLRGFEVDDAARGHIRQRGFAEFFVHRTGHSIGTEVHGTGANMDNFESHDERRIIPRTCFSVEPGVYLPEFGIRSEVNVYVSESEATVTGEVQREVVPVLLR